MHVSYTEFGFVLILEPGDELIRCLIQVAREHEIDGAVITGAGTVGEVELGTGGIHGREHCRTRLSAPLEACSLTGSITLVDGEPFPHLHGCFARSDCSLLGGQVYQAVCAARCEVALQVTSDTRVVRYGGPTIYRAAGQGS